MWNVRFDTTVCQGFPVSVEATIDSPDKDVGIMDYHTDEILLYKRGTNKRVKFIENKLTDADLQKLEEECLEEFHSWRD